MGGGEQKWFSTLLDVAQWPQKWQESVFRRDVFWRGSGGQGKQAEVGAVITSALT